MIQLCFVDSTIASLQFWSKYCSARGECTTGIVLYFNIGRHPSSLLAATQLVFCGTAESLFTSCKSGGFVCDLLRKMSRNMIKETAV